MRPTLTLLLTLITSLALVFVAQSLSNENAPLISDIADGGQLVAIDVPLIARPKALLPATNKETSSVNNAPNYDNVDPGSDNPSSHSQTPEKNNKHTGLKKDLISASLMIIVSEIGDKTFLIAAIMAMTCSRMLIFTAALSALAAMSVLSAALGHSLPLLISKQFTKPLVALLFAIFGIKMLLDARKMPEGNAAVIEEMNDVVEELEAKTIHDMEAGVLGPREKNHSMVKSPESKKDKSDTTTSSSTTLYSVSQRDVISPISPSRRSSTKDFSSGFRNLMGFFFSPTFVQTFIMTFFAEWGDRSQIATIAMASAGSMYMVILGTVIGHALCTGVAVIGGRLLASRISVKKVTLVGGVSFLIFSFLTILIDK